MNEIIKGEVVESSQIVRRDDAPAPAPAHSAHSPIEPRVGVRIRAGTMDDVAFIDRMQKAHNRELGFLPTKALEGKIRLQQCLIAEVVGGQWPVVRAEPAIDSSSLTTDHRPLTTPPIGYLVAADRYQKRDEIGYVTQINVLPEYRRSLVAASLLQAQFDRSAYGCRLYCCWCAQDLKANEFWEAMGFAAIAFRTGGRTKGKKKSPRIHLFWQKRVRADDVTTPWWYPSQTGGGELREDRLVFPIPPGVGWRDVLPVVLAGQEPAPAAKKPRTRKVIKPPRMKGGLWFRKEAIVETIKDETALDATGARKPAIDPRLTALARELRDRWTERAASILPPPAKHDVRRMIASEPRETSHQLPPSQALPEAA